MRLKRILVVDKNSEDLDLLNILLKEKDYSPVVCKSPAEGIKHIVGRRFPLCLVDVETLKERGFSFLDEIRKANQLTEILLISSPKGLETFLKAGRYTSKYRIAAFLLKPLDIESLSNSLKEAEGFYINRIKDLLKMRNLERMLNNKTLQTIKGDKISLSGGKIQDFIHNILDPLTVIVGRVELMKSEMDRLALEEMIQEAGEKLRGNDFQAIIKTFMRINQGIEKIHQNSQRIYHVVDNILIKSLEEGQDMSDKIDINNLILKEIELFKSDFYFKYQIKKFYYFDPFLERVSIDYNPLRRVIDKLIENSITSMYDSSLKQMTIATYQDERYTYISIHDTGRWTKGPLLEIDEPKGDETNNGADSSMHIMDMCHELLRPYYGEIEYESRAESGTTFRILLPRYLTKLEGMKVAQSGVLAGLNAAPNEEKDLSLVGECPKRQE